MAADFRKIKMTSTTEPVSVQISAEEYPQAIVGKVWRYKPDKSKDGSAGPFNKDIIDVPLGVPAQIAHHYFRVEGVVLHMNDAIPTPYKVVVRVLQGGDVLSLEVPPENGSGYIHKEDVAFLYRFQLEPANVP